MINKEDKKSQNTFLTKQIIHLFSFYAKIKYLLFSLNLFTTIGSETFNLPHLSKEQHKHLVLNLLGRIDMYSSSNFSGQSWIFFVENL